MKRRPNPISAGRTAAQFALLPVSAFTVHQLRYLLAYGGDASAMLQKTGHSYLNSVVPWIGLLLALAVGGFLRALGRAFAGHTTVPRYTLSLAGMWLACTASLIAIFVVQELLEGIFLAGHAAGWVGVFGFGGWWAIPSAAIVGLVLATALHGALWALREAVRYAVARRRWPRLRPTLVRLRRSDAVVLPFDTFARGWSGRGPPAALVGASTARVRLASAG